MNYHNGLIFVLLYVLRLRLSFSTDSAVRFATGTSIGDALQQACSSGLHPHCYAFFLHLLTVLAQHNFFQSQQLPLVKLLSRIHDQDLNIDASVRYAWAKSCLALTKHSNVIHVLSREDRFTDILKELCSDSSIFVQEIAHNLIGSLILHLSQENMDKAKVERLIEEFITKPLRVKNQQHGALQIINTMFCHDISKTHCLLENTVTSLINFSFLLSFQLRKTWISVIEPLLSNK